MPVPGLTASVPSPQRAAAQPGLPWLSVAAQRIVDSSGRSVILRGFNDDALLESTVNPAPLDATDATLMGRSGFDVVRLPIAWSLLEPKPGQFDFAYIARIAAAVQLLNEHNLYVVLDMHFLGWSPVYGGSGAPAWATVSGVPDPVWGGMPSLGRFLSPAINVSTANFWLSQSLQQDYIDAWRTLAQRFRQDSGVAGYDLMNEPHSFPLPPIRFDKDQLFPFYARAVSGIGAADPNHLFFLDNDMAGDLPTAVVPLSAPNLVYAPHVYTGSLIPPQFTGDAGPLRTHIDELASEAATVPAALWFGEFDIDFHLPLSTKWIAAAVDAFSQHSSGWAWWQWRESSGYGVRSYDGSAVDTGLLHALARPYVEAASPGVSSSPQGADGLLISVPAGAGDSLEVAWPAYLDGAPNVTSTCGAGASWDRGVARLSVAVPAGGACAISVLR
ncbi:MAG: cellulase family glycosylhydrolase [Candidatus Dormibacteraeota bacterium]|nr:cellulase family glycosylhydrolase [Candidatus Dormibacteraeota bacterium]